MCARDNVSLTRDLLFLTIHLIVTVAQRLRPGCVRALAAESLSLKHQLIVSNRVRLRSSNLTTLDRFLIGLTALFIDPRRIPKCAVLFQPAPFFKFHRIRVGRKYRLLFSCAA